MRHQIVYATAAASIAAAALLAGSASLSANGPRGPRDESIQLGPRPFFLVNDMQDGWLKRQLQSCSAGPFSKSDFSIGHRGAALQFPEHTREAYEAGARMGAGILECDVTFTKDLQLVCRHAQNDLHTTTNILVTPHAAKCTKPFTPAVIGANGTLMQPATAECRTSDVTLAEFKTLRGKMDAFDPRALTPEQFQGGTANFRTDLYAGPTSGELLTHAESIELFKDLGVKMTPELKAPSVAMPFNGFTQEQYAQKMIDEYKAGQGLAAPRVSAVVRHQRRSVLDQARAGVRAPGGVSGRRQRGGRPSELRDPRRLQADGDQHLGAAHLRAAGPRRSEPHRAVAGRARRQGGRTRSHHLDAGALRDPGGRQQRLLLPDDRSGDHA